MAGNVITGGLGKMTLPSLSVTPCLLNVSLFTQAHVLTHDLFFSFTCS